MRYSQCFLPTRREDPADAEVVSHKLLVRAGYIRMLARGVYSFLPAGYRVVRKIEAIIREEMNRAGGQELLMPAVQPGELWEESGRWEQYGPELLRFKDRKGADFCVGPTHEEVITDIVRKEIRSYKQLPLNLYQIQTKFRDEIRPRAGLMRGREFVMKDAYSFDVSLDAANKSYDAMRQAYNRIFARTGLDFRMVEADTGSIGGSSSHEFQVLAQSGEDQITSCDTCEYAANVEMTELRPDTNKRPAPSAEMQEVHTPKTKTVAEVTALLGIDATQLVKTIIFVADESPVAVLVRGDYEVNDVKVRRYLGASTIELADERTVKEVTGAPIGFAGPVALSCRVVADQSVEAMADFVVGANKPPYHLTGVNVGRDFEVEAFADLRTAVDGDACPRCSGTLKTYRGIEVGHIFVLGQKYSDAMGAVFQDEGGQNHPMQMGCYGIGVTRVAAAAIEQNHDDFGIIWPMPIAPYQVAILTLGKKNEEIDAVAAKLHDDLTALGVEVLLDDRDERAAVKFKDADLIGTPIRLTIGGRGLKEGKVEFKWRKEKDFEKIELEGAAATVKGLIDAELQRYLNDANAHT